MMARSGRLGAYGPNYNPMLADSRYTVNVVAGEAHYVAPAAAGGARLTGMLDMCRNNSFPQR